MNWFRRKKAPPTYEKSLKWWISAISPCISMRGWKWSQAMLEDVSQRALEKANKHGFDAALDWLFIVFR